MSSNGYQTNENVRVREKQSNGKKGKKKRKKTRKKGEKEDGQEMTTLQRGRCDLVSCRGKCYPASSVSQLPNLQIRQS